MSRTDKDRGGLPEPFNPLEDGRLVSAIFGGIRRYEQD